ncbi:MAG: D-alanyl-D-alanine carboxypeptidase family protein [Pseudomonadota bacterium]|nr:D-alanyl-D-alanine carboxypeptidase family protein [Pseudomonadota bacterium]
MLKIKIKKFSLITLLVMYSTLCFTAPTVGNKGISSLIPSAPQENAKAYILIEANSNQVLAEKDSEKIMPPASLTKVMSMYVASEALKNGQIHLEDKVRVSKKAWQAEGARMFLNHGSRVEVEKLINGIVIASGNDATTALAEHIAGSEESFAEMMNITAERLGMHNSHFVNATGLPHKNHYTTAKDLAILAKAVINDFPEEYHIYKQKWIEYNHIKQPNRNRLLWRNDKVDGMKTGHTDEAGYCLIAAAKDGDMRLINVQLGAPSDAVRTNNTQALLTWAMRFYETQLVQSSTNEVEKARTWGGVEKYTPVGVKKDLYVTIPKGQAKNTKLVSKISTETNAPIENGQELGEVEVSIGGSIISKQPLYSLISNEQGNIWRRSTDYIGKMWQNIFA